MVNYTLDDLTRDLQKADAKDRLFSWYSASGMLPFANDAQARVAFETRLSTPIQRNAILNAYLPIYSTERNQRNWRNAKTRAALLAGAGLVGIIFAQFMDTKTTKILLEAAAGAASLVVSPMALGIAYLKYRA